MRDSSCRPLAGTGLTARYQSHRLEAVVCHLTFLQAAQKDGLITVTELQQNSLESIGNLGARFFVVAPTGRLLTLQDTKRSTDRFVVVPAGALAVSKVLKIEEYKPPVGSGSVGDEFRLVLGVAHDSPSEQAKALGNQYNSTEPRDVKFRAVLPAIPQPDRDRPLVAEETGGVGQVCGDLGKADDFRSARWRSETPCRE